MDFSVACWAWKATASKFGASVAASSLCAVLRSPSAFCSHSSVSAFVEHLSLREYLSEEAVSQLDPSA